MVNAAPKHPDSSKWYWLLWDTDELQGSSILTSSWELPAGVTLEDESVVGLMVGLKLSGGVLKSYYDATNTITTDVAGEILHETLRFRVDDKGGH